MTLATVIIDPPTALFAGAILSLVSMKLIRTRGQGELWRVAQLSAAWGALYALCVGWFFFNRTDWMFSYALDTSRVPLVPVFAFFVIVCAAWAVLGALGVGALVLLQKTGAALAATALAIGGFALLLYVTLDQYTHIGTRAEYLAGAAKPIMEDGAWATASNLASAVFGLAAVGIIVLQVRRTRAS